VTRETCHTYHAIISAFRKKTGIGAVLNTSLNIHEKPIVWRPVEIADEILVDSGVPLNHILVNDTLFSRRPAREAGGSLAAD
jgi:carbamoyltransferase